MVRRLPQTRRGRVYFFALSLTLAAALLAGFGVGMNETANAQAPQMVVSGTAVGGKAGASPLSKAAFNHQKHEAAVTNCETCHHASMDPCSSCHTSTGGPEGGNVQLSQAMHNAKSKLSCVGCHQQATQKKECAGCHQFIAPGPKPASCANCHKDPKAAPVSKAAPAAPDTVVIGTLSKKYEPTTFNHSSHVELLMDATKKSSLAQAFHSPAGVLCQGCHHNTPADMAPPKCATCHGQAFSGDQRPGLMAAYHIQCNQCHKAMGVDSPKATDCQTCHTAKK